MTNKTIGAISTFLWVCAAGLIVLALRAAWVHELGAIIAFLWMALITTFGAIKVWGCVE